MHFKVLLAFISSPSIPCACPCQLPKQDLEGISGHFARVQAIPLSVSEYICSGPQFNQEILSQLSDWRAGEVTFSLGSEGIWYHLESLLVTVQIFSGKATRSLGSSGQSFKVQVFEKLAAYPLLGYFFFLT